MHLNLEITWATIITFCGFIFGVGTWYGSLKPEIQSMKAWIAEHGATCIRREEAQDNRERSEVALATTIAALASTVAAQGAQISTMSDRFNRWIDTAALVDRRRAE